MFEYDYLEAQTTRAGDNRLYTMARDLEHWISRELEKRRAELTAEHGPEVRIYLTMRSFRNWPVFTLGRPEEDEKKVLEAWYFHMAPPSSEDAAGLQLLLDRVSLRQLFPEKKIEPRAEAKANALNQAQAAAPDGAAPAGRGGRGVGRLNPAPQVKVQTPRKAQVRPQPKPKGFD